MNTSFPYSVSGFYQKFISDNSRRQAEFQYSSISRKGIWEGQNLNGVNFTNAVLERVQFIGCDLRGASFSNVILQKAQFIDCLLMKADFSRAQLQKARFIRCQLDKANFKQALANELYMQQVVLEGVELQGIRGIKGCGPLLAAALEPEKGNSWHRQNLINLLMEQAKMKWAVFLHTLSSMPLVHQVWAYKCWRKQEILEIPSVSELQAYMSENYRVETWSVGELALAGNDVNEYVARTKGQNMLIGSMVKGVCIDRHYESGEKKVHVLFSVVDTPIWSALNWLYWPYPSNKVLSTADWDDMVTNNLSKMLIDEEMVTTIIVQRLQPFLKSNSRILDVACSHGGVLENLNKLFPEAHLLGRDLSPKMVRAAQNRVPSADIQPGNALALGDLEVDVAIVRACGRGVVSMDDAEKMIEEAWRVISPQGHLVVISLTPPNLSLHFWERWSGKLCQSVLTNKGLIACYHYQKKMPKS